MKACISSGWRKDFGAFQRMHAFAAIIYIFHCHSANKTPLPTILSAFFDHPILATFGRHRARAQLFESSYHYHDK